MDNSWRNTEYEAKVHEYIKSRIPAKVFDAHSHLPTFEIDGFDEKNVFPESIRVTESVIGKGKLAGGLTMGNPFNEYSPEEYSADRKFSCENGNKYEGFVTGLLVKPSDTPEEVEEWLNKYPRVVALKPYRNFASSIAENIREIDILTFAPEWMWELADKRKLVVVLHLSHDNRMLSNESNMEQIRYICKKYPNAIMQLAHCAMGHNPYMFKNGLKCLEGLDNVWMDTSGICDALTLIYAFRDFDRKRLMYGTDGYNYGFNMMGKCFGLGETLGARYTGTLIPGVFEPPYGFKGLMTVTEGLVAFFAAADVVGLSQSELEDIFYNNAANLFYSRIRK